MKLQALFNLAVQALVNPDLDWPVASSLVGKQVVQEFISIHRDMAPKHWAAEVHAIADDYELDSSAFQEAWESGTPNAKP